MMAVDVDVEYPWMMSQQFKNSKDNIVNVAEPRSLPLFGMVESARPIDSNVSRARVESLCST